MISHVKRGRRSSPTLSSLARHLDVSHATVSMALRNNLRIKESTRHRIQQHARLVGYRPNRLARALKMRATRVIGCVLPSVVSPFVALLAECLYRETFRRGYQMQMVLSGSDVQQETRAIHECLDAQVDGLLISLTEASDQIPPEHPIHSMLQSKFPCVLLNDNKDMAPLPCVQLDITRASHELTCHLLKQGYRRIHLLFHGSTDVFSVRMRIAGFRNALEENGIPFDPAAIVSREAEWEVLRAGSTEGEDGQNQFYLDFRRAMEAGFQLTRQVMAIAGARPASVICGNDEMAAGAWNACMEAGWRVPEDMGIAGYDNTASQYAGITTVNWNYQGLAAQAVDGVLAQIEGRKAPPSPLVGSEVIPRRSTQLAAPSAIQRIS